MPELSIHQLADLTGMDRKTISNRLVGVAFVSTGDYKNAAKLYEPRVALPAIYRTASDENVTAAQAAVNLSVARREEIDLNMEVTRKERIPLGILCEINDETFSNVAGLLKSHAGKTLTEELVNDLFTELRSIGAKVKERAT
jgi:hypothetical protein